MNVSMAAPTAAQNEQQSSGGIFGNAAGKDTFLKLLVTQIQHQDPLNPQDPTQFVSQLAEFSSLEQLLEMRKSLQNLEQIAALTPETPAGDEGATETENQ